MRLLSRSKKTEPAQKVSPNPWMRHQLDGLADWLGQRQHRFSLVQKKNMLILFLLAGTAYYSTVLWQVLSSPPATAAPGIPGFASPEPLPSPGRQPAHNPQSYHHYRDTTAVNTHKK
ncbi:hypothetical protein EGT74_06535 [Chitinophaga lutea]|uniref:Uncharacterized protein n=1 Tax=Chitinophaga lutea TaxID=2488634 RepID=A0A3N4PWJ7_9BACT|nr:hypothetical protein [Chitinophaga lutea]RPE13183.1 hypothetical protein EGT74_06535 [Chitinophaga lutea]